MIFSSSFYRLPSDAGWMAMDIYMHLIDHMHLIDAHARFMYAVRILISLAFRILT
jgi:hypothetical protein